MGKAESPGSSSVEVSLLWAAVNELCCHSGALWGRLACDGELIFKAR